MAKVTPNTDLRPGRLYPLEPVGLYTPRVESLTGYIARLAEAHSVSAAVLFGYELAPFVDNHYWQKKAAAVERSSLLGYGFLGHTRALNGIGKIASQWVRVLEIATARSDLSRLTLLTWGEVLSALRLQRHKRSWCPACYEEMWLGERIVYEPLVWTVESVNACTLHRRRLRTKCHFCHRQSYPLSSKARPGFCTACGKWLGVSPESQLRVDEALTEEEFEWQSWVVKNVGELLAADTTLTHRPTRETIARSLAKCIEQVFGGRAANLGRAAQLAGQAISKWLAEGIRPRLDMLLRICLHSRVSLLSFLTETIPPAIAVEKRPEFPAVSSERRRTRPPWKGRLNVEEAETVLKKAAQEEPPPCLVEIARRMGRTQWTLRHHFPELCDVIVGRYAAYQKQCRSERLREKELALRTALLDNSYPCTADVARKLGCTSGHLLHRFPGLCRRLHARHVEGREKRWSEVGRTLESMLTEWPPLPMREITKRTGYCESSLSRHYHAACRKLGARYVQYRKMNKRALRLAKKSGG